MKQALTLLLAFTAVGCVHTQPSTPRIADLNCADFPTWHQADSTYRAHGGPTLDPYQLDHDGIPCESLRKLSTTP